MKVSSAFLILVVFALANPGISEGKKLGEAARKAAADKPLKKDIDLRPETPVRLYDDASAESLAGQRQFNPRAPQSQRSIQAGQNVAPPPSIPLFK